jgi:hypothetical protein
MLAQPGSVWLPGCTLPCSNQLSQHGPIIIATVMAIRAPLDTCPPSCRPGDFHLRLSPFGVELGQPQTARAVDDVDPVA